MVARYTRKDAKAEFQLQTDCSHCFRPGVASFGSLACFAIRIYSRLANTTSSRTIRSVDKATAYLVVGVGSALGGMGRFWIAGLMGQRYGDAFPWGTILVNVTGSLAIGILAALAGTNDRLPAKLSPFAAQFFMVGVCGGYTTFSAFSLQTLKLIQAGSWPQAGANMALSVVACVVAVWIGYLLGRVVSR